MDREYLSQDDHTQKYAIAGCKPEVVFGWIKVRMSGRLTCMHTKWINSQRWLAYKVHCKIVWCALSVWHCKRNHNKGNSGLSAPDISVGETWKITVRWSAGCDDKGRNDGKERVVLEVGRKYRSWGALVERRSTGNFPNYTLKIAPRRSKIIYLRPTSQMPMDVSYGPPIVTRSWPGFQFPTMMCTGGFSKSGEESAYLPYLSARALIVLMCSEESSYTLLCNVSIPLKIPWSRLLYRGASSKSLW